MKEEYTLGEIETLTESKLVIGDPKKIITNVAGLAEAGPTDASFLSDPRYTATKYATAFKKSEAGVIFVAPEMQEAAGDRPLLLNNDPSQAFQRLVESFHENKKALSGFEGIHPSAVIHETATIEENVTIGPLAIIDAHTKIRKNSYIGGHCSISPGVVIGEGCEIHSNVTIREYCIIGNRVCIQPGSVIGSCGFGFTTNEKGKHTKLKQVGTVRIEDNVGIGANTTIDRARFKETVIGEGSQIDNLVQIAHGVKIGKHCIVVAQSGIAGSSELEDHVVLAAQTGVAGHLKLAKGTVITARSAVSKSLNTPGGKYGGVPAIPLSEHNHNSVLLRRISKHICALDKLKKEFKETVKEEIDPVK